MSRKVSGEKQNKPFPNGHQCIFYIKEDKNHEATIIFTLDFFHSLMHSRRILGVCCCCYLKKIVYTNAIKRGKRVKRREETRMFSMRVTDISLGLSLLVPQGKMEILRTAQFL